MSVSLTLTPTVPSVGELLVKRAFSRPVKQFVDADVIVALTAAAHDDPVLAPPPAVRDAPPADAQDGPRDDPGEHRVDVRA